MKTQFRSLRLRFLFASLLWVSLATLIAGGFISSLYRWHTTEQYRADLTGHLKELAVLTTVGPDGRPTLQRPMSDPRFWEAGSGFYWQVQELGQAPVKSSTLGGEALEGRFATDRVPLSGWNKGPYGDVLELGVVRAAPGIEKPLRYTIAIDRRLIDDAIEHFNRDLALSLSVFAALMILGATLQISYGLRPVKRIGDSIDELRGGRIARLPAEVPSEFASLVSRLNALLDAQAAVVQRARISAGNLAHGLRTPLALIGGEADQLGNKDNRASADFILAQCDRMQRQIDYHMARASAAGTRVTGSVANVAALVGQIIDVMRRLHFDRNLAFDVDIPGEIDVNCDATDLTEMLSNLIDNACKWAGSTVGVSAGASAGQVTISIIDNGPGIVPEKLTSVFDVGTRLDETKEGRGLGLAISRDLASLYGGTVELFQVQDGGLRVLLTLPLCEPG
jgi:signal transduction histidine kinase